MNREILFRGKRIDNGEWVYGYYREFKHFLVPCDFYYIIDISQNVYRVIPETIGQYTGRLDKNEKKIFEGCKCKVYFYNDPDNYNIGTVEYLNDRYIVRYNEKIYGELQFIKSKDIEVISDKEEK